MSKPGCERDPETTTIFLFLATPKGDTITSQYTTFNSQTTLPLQKVWISSYLIHTYH
jgi:hypothetical protein